MKNNKDLIDALLTDVLALGVSNVAVINVADIQTDTAFREMCESNRCGMYGKCWMCPPECGEISELIEEIKKYKYALVYNQITVIEDSFDIEGMFDAKKKQQSLLKNVRNIFYSKNIADLLFLAAGGCGVCDKCSKITDEPCRHPEQAISSLEAYGVNVSKLAESAGMKYINGKNTVTYFAMVLFDI